MTGLTCTVCGVALTNRQRLYCLECANDTQDKKNSNMRSRQEWQDARRAADAADPAPSLTSSIPRMNGLALIIERHNREFSYRPALPVLRAGESLKTRVMAEYQAEEGLVE